MDDVYLLNSPFTFQSMEKHAAYCAMMRLGLKVPDTVLVPYKNPPDHAKWAYTASRYNQPFDLDAIAERMGYPLFMKPYDGGAWVGVTRIKNRDDLHAAYDDLGAAADAPAEGRRGLRRLRPLAVDRAGDDGDEVPARAADARPLRGRARVPHPRGRRGGRDDLPAGERVLPVGVQLLREPRRGRRGAPDRLRQRLPGRRADLAALLLPVGDDGAGALDGVHAGHRPQAAPGPRHGRLLRDRRPRRPVLRRQAGGLPPARRRVLRDRALPRLLRQPAAPPRRGRAGVGRQPGLRRAAGRDGARDLPGARARPVRRPLPRAGRAVGDATRRRPCSRRAVSRRRGSPAPGAGWPSPRCPSRTSRSPDAHRASPRGGASSPGRHRRSAPRCRLRRR